MAEHSATLDGAMGGGLSAGSEGGLRAALHGVHMPRLNQDEKRRQNPRVIHSTSQRECAGVRAADRVTLDTPRAVIGNGVGDGQEMA